MTRFILVPSLLATTFTITSAALAACPGSGLAATVSAPTAVDQPGAISGETKKESSSSDSFEVSISGDQMMVRMNGKEVPASRIRREADGVVVLDESGRTIRRIPVLASGNGAPGSFNHHSSERSSGGSSSDHDAASDSDSARDSSRSSQRSSDGDSSTSGRRSSSSNSERAAQLSVDAGRMAREIAERMRRESGGFDAERFQREFSERFSRELGESMPRQSGQGPRTAEPRQRIRAEATVEGVPPAGQGRMRYRLALPEGEGGEKTIVEDRPKVMLGVTLAEPEEGLRKHLQIVPGNGTVITQVIEGLPASKAGIEALDVIVQIEGAEGAGPEQVREAIGRKSPGDSMKITINRGGEEREVVVALEAFDDSRLATADSMSWRALAEHFPGIDPDTNFEEIIGQLGQLAPDMETLREQLKSLKIAPLPGGSGAKRNFIFEFGGPPHGGESDGRDPRFMRVVPGLSVKPHPTGPALEERLARMESRLEEVSRMLERVLERLEARPAGDPDRKTRRQRDS